MIPGAHIVTIVNGLYSGHRHTMLWHRSGCVCVCALTRFSLNFLAYLYISFALVDFQNKPPEHAVLSDFLTTFQFHIEPIRKHSSFTDNPIKISHMKIIFTIFESNVEI